MKSWVSPEKFHQCDAIGMSMREYYATLAIPALIEKAHVVGGQLTKTQREAICHEAVAIADELIRALNTPSGE